MARNRKLSRWDYLLGAGGALGLVVCVWLGWQVFASTSSAARRVTCGIIFFVFLLLVCGPEVLEITARRAIRRACQAVGEVVTKIESRKTHFRVFIQPSAGVESRKCVVHSGEVKWIT